MSSLRPLNKLQMSNKMETERKRIEQEMKDKYEQELKIAFSNIIIEDLADLTEELDEEEEVLTKPSKSGKHKCDDLADN